MSNEKTNIYMHPGYTQIGDMGVSIYYGDIGDLGNLDYDTYAQISHLHNGKALYTLVKGAAFTEELVDRVAREYCFYTYAWMESDYAQLVDSEYVGVVQRYAIFGHDVKLADIHTYKGTEFYISVYPYNVYDVLEGNGLYLIHKESDVSESEWKSILAEACEAYKDYITKPMPDTSVLHGMHTINLMDSKPTITSCKECCVGDGAYMALVDFTVVDPVTDIVLHYTSKTYPMEYEGAQEFLKYIKEGDIEWVKLLYEYTDVTLLSKVYA